MQLKGWFILWSFNPLWLSILVSWQGFCPHLTKDHHAPRSYSCPRTTNHSSSHTYVPPRHATTCFSLRLQSAILDMTVGIFLVNQVQKYYKKSIKGYRSSVQCDAHSYQWSSRKPNTIGWHWIGFQSEFQMAGKVSLIFRLRQLGLLTR